MGGCQECAGHSRHSPVFSMSFNLNGTGTKMDQKFKMFQFWSKAAAGTKSLRSIHLPGFFRMHSAQVLWVDNGITQRTSEELLWAWSPSVMFCGHVLVIIPRHVDRRPPARCLSPSHKSEFHGHLLGREMCYAGWQGVLVASTKLTYPTLGKGKSSSKLTFWRGYVSSQEGSFWCLIF